MANLFSGFDEKSGMAEMNVFGSEGNSHGSGNSNGWRTTNCHRSNGFGHRGGIPAIEIADLLRKPPLIKNPDPITFPFNGFKFHAFLNSPIKEKFYERRQAFEKVLQRHLDRHSI